MVVVKGIRGAVVARDNTSQAIRQAVGELLGTITEKNGFSKQDVAALILTATPDLTADFPARAAREMGWDAVPLLSAAEVNVDGALPRVIRALVLINCPEEFQVKHVYLGEAAKLRPDLSEA